VWRSTVNCQRSAKSFVILVMFVLFCAVRLDSVELRCEHGNVLHDPPQAEAST
jgi:hypothetical protein